MTPKSYFYNFDYVPEYRIVLSKRCAFECGYCNFPQSVTPPLPSPKTFRMHLRTAQRLGAHQVTLVAGEGLDQLQEIHTAVRYFGFSSWWEYIAHLCMLTSQAKGVQPLVPVLEVGAVPNPEIAYLRPSIAALRLILDYDRKDFYDDNGILKNAPQKNPLIRLHALRAMARGSVPLMLGVRVGIGESRDDMLKLAETVSRVHQKYGTVHSFHLIPFQPQLRSVMQEFPPISDANYIEAAVVFRDNLPPSITLCAEVNQRLPLMPRVAASGILDIGPFNLGSNTRIALDAREELDKISKVLSRMDITVRPRAAIKSSYRAEHRLAPHVEDQLERYEHRLQHPPVEEPHPSESGLTSE